LELIPIRVDNQHIRMAVDANQPFHADAQARFLSDLPLDCLCHRLTRVNRPAGQAPLAVVGPLCE
jgi:hypothetical protein